MYAAYIHTSIHTYTYAEWLTWLVGNCGRIGAIGSSPSNGLKPNLLGQKGFNPLCQCVYVYVCIVKPDIQTIHRCSHTSIRTYIHTYRQTYTHIHTYIHTCIHTYTRNSRCKLCAGVSLNFNYTFLSNTNFGLDVVKHSFFHSNMKTTTNTR